MKEIAVPEFSRPVRIEDMAEGEICGVIEANAEECCALARRFDLVSIDSITAEYRLLPVSGASLVRLEGRLVADVVQRCVVSLESVPAHIDKTFAETFGPAGCRIPDCGTHAQIPETLDEGGIDLGEVAAQILLLSLDSYPRANDCAAAGAPAASDEVTTRSRPLAALGEMIGKRRK